MILGENDMWAMSAIRNAQIFFTIYALSIGHLKNVNKGDFISKVNEHKIDSAQIIGLYSRR